MSGGQPKSGTDGCLGGVFRNQVCYWLKNRVSSLGLCGIGGGG